MFEIIYSQTATVSVEYTTDLDPEDYLDFDSREDVEAEILKKLKNSASFVHELNVLVCPMGDIPEQKQLTLVILHPSLAMPTGGTPSFSLRVTIYWPFLVCSI